MLKACCCSSLIYDCPIMSLLPSTTRWPYYKSSLSSFPAELLHEVLQYSATSELLALCLTCKSLYTTSVRFLYRVVSLSSPSQAVKCCKSILCHHSAAFSVRRFSMYVRYALHAQFRLFTMRACLEISRCETSFRVFSGCWRVR